MLPRSLKFLVGAAVLSLGGWAQATTCTATSAYTNPDATLTNSNQCGAGILNDNNESEADIATVTGIGAWTLLAKDNADGSDSPNLLTSGVINGLSSGGWAFNSSNYEKYVLVIKDGGAPGGNADSIFWAWFVVDRSAGCDSSSGFAGYSYCGTWSMYGDGGKLKTISHLSLYGYNQGGGGDDDEVPEPATLALVGAGMLAAAGARRRRRT